QAQTPIHTSTLPRTQTTHTPITPSSTAPPPPPRSTLFTYTTLFRSGDGRMSDWREPYDAPDAPELAEGGRLSQTLLAKADRCERSEEHTSELQSRGHLVCRLLLEKKNMNGGD